MNCRTYDSTQFSHPGQIHVKICCSENLPEIDVYLYSGIQKVAHYSMLQTPPTLYELAMRKTYDIFSKTTDLDLDENKNFDSDDFSNYNKFYYDDFDQEGNYFVNGHSFIQTTQEILYVDELPNVLSTQLKEGPNAICQYCKIGIFEQGVLCFLHR